MKKERDTEHDKTRLFKNNSEHEENQPDFFAGNQDAYGILP